MGTYQVNPNVRWVNAETGAVLLNLDLSRYFSLNKTAADVWAMLSSETSLDSVLEKMRLKYGSHSGQVQSDVSAFVEKLCGLGFLQRVTSPEDKPTVR